MKKLLIGASLFLIAFSGRSQNILENVIVEPFHVATAADAANGGPVAGSVTWRIYLDLSANSEFLFFTGDKPDVNRTLKFSTTTTFFNHASGDVLPNFTKANAVAGTVGYDSYLTAGAATNDNYFGVPKSIDPSGYALNTGAAFNAPSISPGVNFTPNFKNTAGASYESAAVSVGPDLGQKGYDAAGQNILLIGQFTTNGTFCFNMSVGVRDAGGNFQLYIFSDDVIYDGTEVTQTKLAGCPVLTSNAAPTATITAPADGATFTTGAAVAIAANAADSDGTVASVEFFVDGTSVGVDNSSPYTASYTAVAGTHVLTAKATDNEGLVGAASTAVNITVSNANVAPTATVTAPANGDSFTTGSVVAITATGADTDGTVASIEFFVDGTSVGVDNSSPFTANYTAALGNHAITAKATDNLGLTGAASAAVNIVVANGNVAPTATITAPADGATFTTGASVAITATGADSDGSVASIEFFVDGTSIGVDNSSPYTANYTAVVGNHAITAKAKDNQGLVGAASTAVNIVVSNANVAPTATITAPSNGANYFVGNVVAISATGADSDGSVASIEFFVDGTSVGVDNAAPYTASYTAAVGSHAITAKATDNQGLTGAASAAVNINVISAGGAPYLVGTLTDVCTNPSFCLPIYAIDTVKNVIGYDLTLNYNPAKVHATGNITINSALINPTYASYVVNNNAVAGSINISVYLNGTAPANAAFNGVGELVCVEFTKDASLLAVDTALFSVPTLQESYVTGVADKLAGAGKYINKKNTAYDGSLKFWSDNSPIKYDIANPSQYLITNIYGTDASCGNKSATAVQPDLLGKFSYNTLNGSSISIERDILPTTLVLPVINGFDASLANKVMVNDLSFIPNIYQAIALDVNADGVISAGDVSQINQRTADVIHEFKQKWNYSNNGTSNGQLSKDWLFVDSTLLASPAYKISTTYPSNDGAGYSKSKVPVVPFCLAIPVTGPTTCATYDKTTYKGILLGDVDGSYDAIANDGKIKKTAEVQEVDGTVYFNLDQATAGAGYIDVPVSFVSTADVVSFDISAQINEKNLSYNSVSPKVDYLTDALGNYSELNKTFIFTSNSSKNYESDKNIIAIRFNTLNGVVSNSDIFNVTGLLNGKTVKAELKGNIATGISTSDNKISVAVYPNPATNVINVVAPERAIVEFMDVTGRQVLSSTIVNANQKQEISTETLANGTYMLKIYNDNFVSTQRIVIENNK